MSCPNKHGDLGSQRESHSLEKSKWAEHGYLMRTQPQVVQGGGMEDSTTENICYSMLENSGSSYHICAKVSSTVN